MKKFGVFIISQLLSVTLISQNWGRVSGQVLSQSHQEITSATVLLMNAADSSLTKAWTTGFDGTFDMSNIGAGNYFVQATFIGFEDFSGSIFEVYAGEEHEIPTIFLNEKMEMLQEVIVQATRPIIEIMPDRTVFNIDGSINATASNALELLRKAPGILVENTGKLMLLGSSGVQVYIDEKPTYLGTDDLADFLKSMPSIEIDAIEIITNPSVKYDAAGNAGVINIRMKKNKDLGFSADVNTAYHIGTYAKYNNSINFNYRKGDINVFGRYGNNVGKRTNNNNIYREQADKSFDETAKMRSDYLDHRFRLGSDWSPNYKSTIGILLSAYINEGTFHTNRVVDISQVGDKQSMSILNALNNGDQNRNNLTVNLNYAYNDGMGTKFNIDADLGHYQNRAETHQPNRYLNPDGNELLTERIFSSSTPTSIDISTIGVDFETPFWNGQLAFGGKFSAIKSDNVLDFFDLIGNVMIKDLDRSKQFKYFENIAAVFGSFQKQITNWNFSLGLRLEHTNSEGALTGEKLIFPENIFREYLDWFPHAGITFNVNDQNTLRLNYSRRIERPSYEDLNPFEFKLNELTFLRGNALLNPQYAHSVVLNHTFKSKLSTTLSFRMTNGLISRINDTLNTDATVITFVNLDQQKVVSLAFSYPFTVTSWWSIFANVSTYQSTNKSTFDSEKTIDITALTVHTSAQNTFMLPKDLKLELSGFYRSPFAGDTNFEFDAIYSIDLGLQKRLLKDRATLKISVTDILNTQKMHGSSQFGDLKMIEWSGWESRQFRINFNYQLGNRQMARERRRNIGMEDEQKRIKKEDDN